jgi:hypothetical protein
MGNEDQQVETLRFTNVDEETGGKETGGKETGKDLSYFVPHLPSFFES